MLDQVTIQRLGLIRYLYDSAVEESRKPAPFGATSILKFHDSVELFLQLSAEYLNIGKTDNINFMQYWDIIEDKLPNGRLEQKESMRRFNKARVAFKHNGTLSSALDIEAFRASVTNFFEGNTLLVFSIRFGEISLTSLISNTVVRTLLEEANALLEQDDRPNALDKIAVAFAQLMDDTASKFGRFHMQKLFLHKRMPSLRSRAERNIDSDFVKYVKEVATMVEDLNSAISMFTLGIDYQKYVKFTLWTPHVVRYMGSKDFNIAGPDYSSGRYEPPPIDKCRFCYDFVVECAITIQSVGFEQEVGIFGIGQA